MTLRSRVVAVIAVPVIVLVASTVVLSISRHRTTQTLEAERQTHSILDGLQEVLNDLVDAETGMRGYLLTGDPDYLRPYDRGVVDLEGDLGALGRLLSSDGSQIGRIERLEALASQRVELLEDLLPFVPITDRTDRAALSAQLDRGRFTMDEIRVVVSQMRTRAEQLLEERNRHLDATRHVSFLVGIIGMPIAVLASLLLVGFSARSHLRRVRAIEHNARRLQDGLPMLDADPRDDEVGRLERALIRSGTRVLELQGELQRQATLDPLTRLPNRRGFVPMAEHRIEVAKRSHQPLALMFVDVDGLKHVNDRLGHATGDWLIAETAYVLRTTFRASDLIARMGGDEFCVLFAAESEAAIEATQRRLRGTIDTSNADPDRPFRLSMSMGVARFDPEDPHSLDELMAVADGRMYEDKRARQDEGVTSSIR